MSDFDPNLPPGRDTRPEWMLDPTIDLVDEAAIAIVGQQLQQQNIDAMSSQFISRGVDAQDNVPTPQPLAPPLQGQQGWEPPTTPPVIPTDQPNTPPPVSTAQGSEGAPTTTPPQGGGGAAPEAGQQSTPPSPTVMTLNLPDGQSVEVNQDQVYALMQNYQWMASRPEAVLQAWGGIEQGTHHAIPNTEYAEFTRWKQTQGIAQAVGRRPVQLDDLDPDVAEYIGRLEAQAYSTGQPVGQPTAPTDRPPMVPGQAPFQPQGQPQPTQPVSALDLAAQQAHAVQRQVRLQTSLAEVRNEMATQYGLTPEQVDRLQGEVTAANLVPGISMKYATRNPMGQVIQEADPMIVFREAFEATMATSPVFRQIRDDAVYNQRLQRDTQANQNVASKKAAAGSLAHTPSAAVSAQGNGSPNPAQMTPQQLQQAMVEELRQLMESGQASN